MMDIIIGSSLKLARMKTTDIIDQPINDGVLVVWKGITLADLSIFDKSTKRSGEDDKKNKKD